MLPNNFRGPDELKFSQDMRMYSVCYAIKDEKYNWILTLYSPRGFSSLQTDKMYIRYSQQA